jgi:heat shock protein HtpX
MRPKAKSIGSAERAPRVKNTVRIVVLLGAVGISIIGCGALLGGSLGILFGFVLAAVVVGGSWWFSEELVIRACDARPLRGQAVSAIVAELSSRVAIPPPRCYVAPIPQPNAFAVGRTPTHATIVVTEGLLCLLEPREIRAVLAQELIHICRCDTLATSLVGATVSRVVDLAEKVRRGCRRRKRCAHEGPGVVVAWGTRLATRVIRLAFSSDRESEADRDGSALTQNPEAMAQALKRMQRYADVVPMEMALAHVSAWLVNPLGGRQDSAWLFSTDSPVADRVDRLQVWSETEGGHTIARHRWRMEGWRRFDDDHRAGRRG